MLAAAGAAIDPIGALLVLGLGELRAGITMHQTIEAFLRDYRAILSGASSLAYLVQGALAVSLVVLQQSVPR